MTTTVQTTTIRQSVTFQASPNDVYQALMDSARHARFTGAKASISPDAKGAFSAYDGGIRGTNLELQPDEKIVQAWQCAADGWPNDHFSKLTITLSKENGGTRLELNHTEVPEAALEECNNGWREEYWNKMKAEFGW